MKLPYAIVWPLTDDQSLFAPYIISDDTNGTLENFAWVLQKELKGHIREALKGLNLENEFTETARAYLTLVDRQDVEDCVAQFECITDELAGHCDAEEMTQWRVRVITN